MRGGKARARASDIVDRFLGFFMTFWLFMSYNDISVTLAHLHIFFL